VLLFSVAECCAKRMCLFHLPSGIDSRCDFVSGRGFGIWGLRKIPRSLSLSLSLSLYFSLSFFFFFFSYTLLSRNSKSHRFLLYVDTTRFHAHLLSPPNHSWFHLTDNNIRFFLPLVRGFVLYDLWLTRDFFQVGL